MLKYFPLMVLKAVFLSQAWTFVLACIAIRCTATEADVMFVGLCFYFVGACFANHEFNRLNNEG